MSYSKKESAGVYKKLDKQHYQSIELGFDGHISHEFLKKLKKVKKVRRRLKIELAAYVLFLAFAATGYSTMDDLIKIGILIMMVAMIAAIYKNLKIWNEISKIKQERFNAYYKQIEHK